MSWFGSFGKSSPNAAAATAQSKPNDGMAAHDAHKMNVAVIAPPVTDGSKQQHHSLMDWVPSPVRRWTEVHHTTEVPAPQLEREPASRRGSEFVGDGPEAADKAEKGRIGLTGKAFHLFRGSTFALPGEPQRVVAQKGVAEAAPASPSPASPSEGDRGGFSFAGTRRTTSTPTGPKPASPAASTAPSEDSPQLRGGFTFAGERRRPAAPSSSALERAPSSPGPAVAPPAGGFFLGAVGERRPTSNAAGSPRTPGKMPSAAETEANAGGWGFPTGERRRTMSETGEEGGSPLTLARSSSFFRNFTRLAPTAEERTAIAEAGKQRGGFVFPSGERRSRRNSEAEDAPRAVVPVDAAAVAEARARGGFGFVGERRVRRASEKEEEPAAGPEAAAGAVTATAVDAAAVAEARARGGFGLVSGERRRHEGEARAVGHDLVPVDAALVAEARARGGFAFAGERRERSRHNSETERAAPDPEATAEARARGGFGFMSGERSREYHGREAAVQPQFAAAAALVAGDAGALRGFSFPAGERTRAAPAPAAAAPAADVPATTAVVKSDVPTSPAKKKDPGLGSLAELDSMHEAGGVRALARRPADDL